MGRLLLATVTLCTMISPAPAWGQRLLVELEVDGQRVEGSPVAWTSRDVLLLGRDGRLFDFAPGEVKKFRKLSTPFASATAREMRGDLSAEFGSRFDISGTGHYLVVHPKGQRDRWARRFEDLYRSFVQYYTARGFRVQRLDFPLVAVVFHDKGAFLKYARATGANLTSGTLGYYSPSSNRILIYDVTAGRDTNDQGWYVNAETIIHEAAHQSAFNTGIHSRYAMPPRWIVEGLGTSFEAPGVWNQHQHRSRRDRINQEQLANFRSLQAKRRKGYLAEFISTDRTFNSNPLAAYAEAWSLTFFLIETRPREYFELLKRTASLPAFEPYRAPDRLRDFSEVFGTDLEMLEAHFLRFMNGL